MRRYYRHRNLIGLISLFFTFCVTLWTICWCGSATFEGRRPLLVSMALFRLSQSPNRDAVQPVWLESNRWAEKTQVDRGVTDGPTADPIGRMLTAQGWQFAAQTRTERLFQDASGNQVRLTCASYSERFQVCTATPLR